MNFLFYLYFFLLPWQFALVPMRGIDLALIRPVTLAVFLAWVLFGFFRRKVIIPPLFPLFLLSGFFCTAAGSFFWSENGDFAFRKTLFLFSFYPLFVVLSSWFVEHPNARIKVLRSFVGGAFLAACSGLLLFFSQFVVGVERIFSLLTENILPFFLGTTFAEAVAEHPSLLVNISGVTVLRASGVFPDPHMFSFFLGMAAPIALAFLMTATTEKKKYWGIVVGIIILTDLLSFSRGAYVGLLVGTAVFVSCSRIQHHFRWRQKVPAFLLAFFILGVLLVSPVGTRFFSSFSGEDGSNVERLRLWQEAFGHISEHPFFGVGLGNYATLVNPEASYRDPIYAHSLFLDIAVEVGLVGLIFFVALLGTALFWTYRRFRKEQDWFALSLTSSLTLFSIHSFFETPLFSVHVLPALLLFLAVSVSYGYDKIPS